MNKILYRILKLFIPSKKWRRDLKFLMVFRPRLNRGCHITQSTWKLHKNGIKIPHPIGIVIGENVKIGKNCTIYQNSSFVQSYSKKNPGQPTLKDNVIVYSNSVIMGNITIGENSIVGAGSVVTKNIPDNEVWIGSPARFLRKVENRK